MSPECGKTRPHVFVYDLPESYRMRAPSTRVGQPVGFPFVVSSGQRESMLAAPTISGPGGQEVGSLLSSLPAPPCPLRNTTNYALAGVFLAKAHSYVCRTTDPSLADLFIIPTFNEEPGRSSDCASAGCDPLALGTRLRQVRNARGVSYLDARGGRDHLLLTPREGAASDARPYADVDFSARLFGASTRLAVEEGAAEYEWPSPRFRPLRFFHSTPFASYVHLVPPLTPSLAPWRRPQRTRPILASTASNLHHEGWKSELSPS